jgi:hypothetical protein
MFLAFAVKGVMQPDALPPDNSFPQAARLLGVQAADDGFVTRALTALVADDEVMGAGIAANLVTNFLILALRFKKVRILPVIDRVRMTVSF